MPTAIRSEISVSESDLLSFGAAMLAALAVGALAYAFLYPYLSGDREKESRLKGVIEPKGRNSLSALEQAASRRKSVADTLKDMEDRQKAAEKVSLRLRLERAGLDITPRVYWLASLACGAIFAFGVTMALQSGATRTFLSLIIGLTGVFGFPRWFINKLTARRQARFIRELPYLGVLLKKEQDLETFAQAKRSGSWKH
jgi:tight adherence protein B